MNQAPIGIFDSGLGGLTVARAIYRKLPNESTLYFGDTARVPYGPKSPTVVRRYSLEITEWMVRQGVKAVVVACNTSTAHALDLLHTSFKIPVIGVIAPGARAAARAGAGRPIGVIATAGTVASGAYERAIHREDPGARVISAACPLLVPFVEEGWFDHPATRLVAEEYLNPLRDQGIGTLVLGCTHYPLLRPLLSEILGPSVALIDSAEETARSLAAVLGERGLVGPTRPGGRGDHRVVVSDDPERFGRIGAQFLGEAISLPEVVTLGVG